MSSVIVEKPALNENNGVSRIPPPTDGSLAVTGFGLSTCLGVGAAENWKCIRRGASGLRPITRFELGHYPVRLGGEVPDGPVERDEGVGTALNLLAGACHEACVRAGLEDGRFPEPDRVALVVGSSLAGSSTGERFFTHYLERGPEGADFGLLEGYYIESHLGELCRRFNICGPSVLVSNACAAGGSSIARGAALLRAGRADRVLCAGYDPLSIFTFAGFGSLLALTQTVVKPFDRNRDGMLLGDGYAAVVLERLQADNAAGRAVAVLAGCGESTDSHHLTHPHPEGSGAALAMRRALGTAGLSSVDIDYINCHGTATRPNDAAESRAMRSVFGERLSRIPVSSSKPFFGHTLGGAGTVEAVVTLLALEHQFLPPTLNVEEAESELGPLDLVPRGRPATIRYAMSNSFGFGGSNTSLILAANFPATKAGAGKFSARSSSSSGATNFFPPRSASSGAPLSTGVATAFAEPHRPLVAVTGLGAVSPLGLGADELWDKLVAGASGLGTSPSSSRGINVPESAATVGEVSRRVDDVVSPKFLRRLANLSRYAVGAASLCFQEPGRDARWGGAARRDATAVLLGTCFGCSAYHFEYYEKLFRHGIKDASPLLFSESVMNAASGHISIHLKLRGASLALVGGEEVGLAAIADAADRIRLGEATAALAGGAEEYCDFVHAWLASQGYVTGRAARPYAGDETGGFLGEGATLLLLEDARSVMSTGGRPLAFVAGAATARAGEGAVAASTVEAVERAIRDALGEAELSPQAVDLVVSSAAGTVFDGYEAKGIARALDTRSRTGSGRALFVAAPNAVLGEAFACSSATQALVGVKALAEGVVPPLPDLSRGVDLPAGLKLASEPLRKDLEHALVVSVSTRGNAVAVLLSRTT